jgi:hypothetical protein
MIARWMIVGFVLWLVTFAAFYFVRPLGVLTTLPGGVTLLFIALPILMFALTYFFLNALKVPGSDRAEASSVFALPGLAIGILLINSFDQYFPNLAMRPNEFASLMFASTAGIVFAGILSSRLASD